VVVDDEVGHVEVPQPQLSKSATDEAGMSSTSGPHCSLEAAY